MHSRNNKQHNMIVSCCIMLQPIRSGDIIKSLIILNIIKLFTAKMYHRYFIAVDSSVCESFVKTLEFLCCEQCLCTGFQLHALSTVCCF